MICAASLSINFQFSEASDVRLHVVVGARKFLDIDMELVGAPEKRQLLVEHFDEVFHHLRFAELVAAELFWQERFVNKLRHVDVAPHHDDSTSQLF